MLSIPCMHGPVRACTRVCPPPAPAQLWPLGASQLLPPPLMPRQPRQDSGRRPGHQGPRLQARPTGSRQHRHARGVCLFSLPPRSRPVAGKMGQMQRIRRNALTQQRAHGAGAMPAPGDGPLELNFVSKVAVRKELLLGLAPHLLQPACPRQQPARRGVVSSGRALPATCWRACTRTARRPLPAQRARAPPPG